MIFDVNVQKNVRMWTAFVCDPTRYVAMTELPLQALRLPFDSQRDKANRSGGVSSVALPLPQRQFLCNIRSMP